MRVAPPPISVAVVGLGVMGRNHVRVISELESARLVAIADTSPAARSDIARRTDARPYADAIEMLGSEHLDAVIVAVPTQAHRAIACAAIDRGVHVLIEKPIAASAADAAELIRAAERREILLGVGHIERFNPAIRELKARIARGQLGQIFQIQTRRQSPFPARVADVGVAIDLATHDIDLVRYLTSAEPEHVYARTARRLHNSNEDLLSAIISFPGGIVATIDVNWLTPTKIRELVVLGESGMFVVRHLAQELSFYANTAIAPTGEWSTLAQLVGVSEGDVTRFAIAHQEPLLLELTNFINACAGREALAVTARDGLRALEIAEALLKSAAEGTAVPVA